MADDIFQQLSHIGSALGPIAVTVTGFLSRAVKKVTEDITEAKKLATEALRLSGEASRIASEAKTLIQGAQFHGQPPPETRKVSGGFDDLRRGLRLELTTLRNDLDAKFSQASQELRALVRQLVEEAERRIDHNLERIVRGSRPEGVYESDALLVEVRGKLVHEQEQRIALQQTLTAHMKDGVERWLKMERFIGNIETTVETWNRERDALDEKIEREKDALDQRIDSLRSELRDLRGRPR